MSVSPCNTFEVPFGGGSRSVPKEVFNYCLDFLPAHQVCRIERCCRTWQKIASSHPNKTALSERAMEMWLGQLLCAPQRNLSSDNMRLASMFGKYMREGGFDSPSKIGEALALSARNLEVQDAAEQRRVASLYVARIGLVASVLFSMCAFAGFYLLRE